jgi:hypothetical protein
MAEHAYLGTRKGLFELAQGGAGWTLAARHCKPCRLPCLRCMSPVSPEHLALLSTRPGAEPAGAHRCKTTIHY